MVSEKDIPKSCAAFAARFIVEGCLPIIEGSVKGKAPVEPVPVTEAERTKLGLKHQGVTLFYPAGEEGVFFDMAGSETTIWFTGADCEKATSALHDALMRAYPGTRQLDDVAHPTDRRMRARVYRVELRGGKLAAISTSFSKVGSKHRFTAHVAAQQRPTAPT